MVAPKSREKIRMEPVRGAKRRREAYEGSPPEPDMEAWVEAVERILGYSFRNKKLLEEALTHPSFGESEPNFERLEFVGDAVLGLAVTNYLFLAYPQLGPGSLSSLRAANISTEKLARVAVRHGLYRYIRSRAGCLDNKVVVAWFGFRRLEFGLESFQLCFSFLKKKKNQFLVRCCYGRRWIFMPKCQIFVFHPKNEVEFLSRRQ